MLNKILAVIILLSILLIALLLNPWSKNLPTETLTISAKIAEKSALDEILFSRLEVIKSRPNLLKSLSLAPKTISIKSLWVDKYEVLQADFYKFVGWSRVHDSSSFFALKQPQDWKFYSSSKTHGLSGKLGVSANGISFYDAWTYCGASGGRLPTADEFVAISTSHSGQLYPWGDRFNAKPWPYYDARLNATLKPGSFPSTDTKDGIADMGALVSEWTLGDYPQGKPFIQGGNGHSNPYQIYALNMVYREANAQYRSAYVGFRCVYEKKPKSKTLWKNKIKTVHIRNKKIEINQHPHSTIRPLLHYLPRLSVKTFKSLLPIKRKSDYQLSVGVNEVSVDQYAKFLADIFTSVGVYAHEQQPENHSLIPLDWALQKNYPQRPVVGVDWWSAYHFANWAGGRLPSRDESIKIQILTKEKKSIFLEHKQAHPAHLKPENKVAHFLGNVSEWTRSIDSLGKNLALVVRGGSFLIGKNRAEKIDFYRSISPHHRAKDIGFRVVFE